MPNVSWFVVAIVFLLIGAWAGTKYPSLNVIGKVIP